MEIVLIREIVIILGLSVLVIYFFERFRLPTILGLLLTGMIAGPNGLGSIQASHEVEMLSEIGVVLLLFIIGLEFSLKNLYAIRQTILIAGTFQVLVTIGITTLWMYLLGFSWQRGVFMGFLFSLSSTAIVLKILQTKSEVSSPHGKIALGVLIFQDIVVVPMMLFTPLIAGNSSNVWLSLLDLCIKALLVILGVWLSARYIYPYLMYEVAKTRNRELFIITVVVTCLLVAWLTSLIGLSLALGAFLAGLIISESEYSHQATSIVIPFREIFASFFFVSIGMLLNIHFVFNHFLLISILVVAVLIGKGFIAVLAAALLRYPLRTCLLSGLALFQVGEFAFILSKIGIENKLLSPEVYQYFLAVSILSMAITPFVLLNAESIVGLIIKSPLREGLGLFAGMNNRVVNTNEVATEQLEDHIIVIGYGVNGRNLVQAAKYAHIPYVIVELNPETVRQEVAKNEPILYGDATQVSILEHVQVYQARAVVIAISDPIATKRVVQSIRNICKTVYIIVRTRYISDIEEYHLLGANEVIAEEFETSVEIFTRVLHKYLLPEEEINSFVDVIRTDKYQVLRPRRPLDGIYYGLEIPNLRVSCLNVQNPDANFVGKCLGDSDIRQMYGVNILAIQRQESLIIEINKQTKILLDDNLYVMGQPNSIAQFNKQIKL
ncbi:MAG: cation:proton antiporter [Microscillaceae bacterium]|nr:cation:proton antiporter [Microscillaceae bacterium]